MKIYQVVSDRDGETTREPGKHNTEIVREVLRYAADSIEDVWDAIEWIRTDQERTLIGVFEEHPSVTVLNKVEGAKP